MALCTQNLRLRVGIGSDVSRREDERVELAAFRRHLFLDQQDQEYHVPELSLLESISKLLKLILSLLLLVSREIVRYQELGLLLAELCQLLE